MIAIAKHADDTMAAHFGCDFNAQVPKFRGDPLGGLLLVKGKFRVRVEVVIQSFQRGVLFVQPGTSQVDALTRGKVLAKNGPRQAAGQERKGKKEVRYGRNR